MWGAACAVKYVKRKRLASGGDKHEEQECIINNNYIYKDVDVTNDFINKYVKLVIVKWL